MHLIEPHHDFYQKQLDTILKMQLPSGCSERDFLAVARRLIYDINPHLRAPYEGVASHLTLLGTSRVIVSRWRGGP